MRAEAMAFLSKMWKAISAKRTATGWILFLCSLLLHFSDKWDSLNSLIGKIKNMGSFFKFIVDAAQSPLVQICIFILGILWIGIAAMISAKRTGRSYDAEDARIVPAQDFSDPVYDRPFRRTESSLQPDLQSRRRLKISCDPGINGCVSQVEWSSEVKANYSRIKIEADSDESIPNCTGFLTYIEKDGKRMWGVDNAQLTFALGQERDTLSKTIRPGVPEFLDVLAVSSKNEIYPSTKGRTWPYWPKLSKIFSESGDYLLTVLITGNGVPTVTALLEFAWTQNWETAALSLIPESSIDRQITAPGLTAELITQRKSGAARRIANEAIRIAREDNITFTLYALQNAGVGTLDTEDEFQAARELIIQSNLPDPTKDLSLMGDLRWLKLVRFANEKEIALYSKAAVYDCIQAFFSQPASPKEPQPLNELDDGTKLRPLEIEALPISPQTENLTQLGTVIKGGAVFCGKCIFSIHNPNQTQGITGIGFRLLSIDPPLRNPAGGFRGMSDNHTLRRIKFPIDDIEGNCLKGDQTAQVHIFTATRKPFAEPESLRNITINIHGKWPVELKNEFSPDAEHILLVEATGDNLRTKQERFKISFSPQFEDNVFTMTKRL